MTDRFHHSFEDSGYSFAVTTEPEGFGYRASFVTISQGDQILDQFAPHQATFETREGAAQSGRIAGLVRLGLPYR